MHHVTSSAEQVVRRISRKTPSEQSHLTDETLHNVILYVNMDGEIDGNA